MARSGHFSAPLLLVLLAAASARAGRLLLGSPKPVGYVPKGCTLADVKVTATYEYRYTVFGPRVIRGTVKLSNGNGYAVPISKVQVTLAPAVPVSPYILTAKCPSSSVPASARAYEYGTLTCTFESPNLPTSGPAAGFGGWKTADAVVTIGMSGATCTSKVANIKGWILTDILDGSSSGGRGSSSGGGVGSGKPAAAGASSGPLLVGRRLSEQEAESAAAAPAPVTYVPSSDDCLGMTISASATESAGVVSGTVFIANSQAYPIPLAAVTVQVNNDVPVAPIFADAVCQAGMSVPTSPQPFALGTLACTFSAQLPSAGIASDPSRWTGVMPKVTVAMSNAHCSGAVAPIQQSTPSGPLVYGH